MVPSGAGPQRPVFIQPADRRRRDVSASARTTRWSRSTRPPESRSGPIPPKDTPTNRGFNYWESKDRSDRRLIFAVNSYLQEINARTGVTINTFGNDGRVDLAKGLGRDPKTIGNIQSGTPGRVFENLIILGSAPGEGYGSAPGDIRAYDVLHRQSSSGRSTPFRIPANSAMRRGRRTPGSTPAASNTWGEISIDEKRGIAYFPLGSPTYDFYGADRIGENLFGDCLLALDARTGKRLWHFQFVHHDLWDYDPTAAPKLLTVRHDGKTVDVVAQPTKFGFLYVFDRVTGEPLWPIEERPVPKSDVPGEAVLADAAVSDRAAAVRAPEIHGRPISIHMSMHKRKSACAISCCNARNEGLFTPPAHAQHHRYARRIGRRELGQRRRPTPKPECCMCDPRTRPPCTSFRCGPPRRMVLSGTPEQQGHALFSERCEGCHGPNRNGVVAPRDLGLEKFKAIVSGGQGEMPAFSDLTPQDLTELAAYIDNPAAGALPESRRLPRPRPLPMGKSAITRPTERLMPITVFPRLALRGRLDGLRSQCGNDPMASAARDRAGACGQRDQEHGQLSSDQKRTWSPRPVD